ncbi:MAG TPA: hypothetical protein VKQ52_06760, partial [Puia sp.]|nr:hypothetical protein [Puia sp.]
KGRSASAPNKPDHIRLFENHKSISMFTRKHTIFGTAILPLFIALTLTAPQAFSQNYHYKIASVAQCNTLDSILAARLQVSIKQTDAGEMKFRVTILNPTEHTVSIAIRRGNDLIFEDLTGKTTYDNVFNLSDLEDGNYVILISSGKEKISRNIRIQTETKVDRQLTVN